MPQSLSRILTHLRNTAPLALAMFYVVNLCGWLTAGAFGATLPDKGPLQCDFVHGTEMRFTGFLSNRIAANTAEWLLQAPQANPAMIEMFRARDRQPVPKLVPWAGEFVGKYLISAIQAARLDPNPELRRQIDWVVSDFLSTQSPEGYLGPFRKEERLRGHWDLWGHYHAMQALLLWHHDTGHKPSLEAAIRAADFICATFLKTGLRVKDAGSPEMNMAVIHVLGELHRLTGERRYFEMMLEIEKDWESTGDYLRSALAGQEFYRSPLPRWESLHDLQGLVELFRITGDEKYRRAFIHLWRSIARWDIHNSGAFSSGEQATGNPYAPGAIETCCTIAWMALTLDYVRLTSDPRASDYFELALYNGALGAQHPSGRWWTYNTPMDGVREASAHSIVFQARAGSPELNCCSVNGPRSLGMLSEWTLLREGSNILLNSYSPGEFAFDLPDGGQGKLRIDPAYPFTNRVNIRIVAAEQGVRLKLRIPGWSKDPQLSLNGGARESARPGTYQAVSRPLRTGDWLTLDFGEMWSFQIGDRELKGKASFFYGPVLFAFDPRWNSVDEHELSPIDLQRRADPSFLQLAPIAETDFLAPRLKARVQDARGRSIVLVDYASAGNAGTRYASWLAVSNAPPPVAVPVLPLNGSIVGPGKFQLRWSGARAKADFADEYKVEVLEGESAQVVLALSGIKTNRYLFPVEEAARLKPHQPYFWRVVAVNRFGETASPYPWPSFSIDPAKIEAPATNSFNPGPNGLLISDPLRGKVQPVHGMLKTVPPEFADKAGASARGISLASSARQKIVYAIEEFPEEDYSACIRFKVTEFTPGLAQLMSAWCAGSDDPLRLVIDQKKLHARIEAGHQHSSTPGVDLELGRGYHAAVVKKGNQLSLFLDGQRKRTVAAPQFLSTGSRQIGIGCNPLHTGPEFLSGQLADFHFFGRALSPEEIAKLSGE